MNARFVYLVGPSGAGKDALMDWARRHAPAAGIPLAAAHRYITRPREAGGEDHVPLSREEFALRRDAGLFVLHWESHGNAYGIGVEVLEWLKAGLSVLANGSRAYLPEAGRRLPGLRCVWLTAETDVLAGRLASRGREGPEQIRARLARNRRLPHPHDSDCLVIDNSGALEDAGNQLLQVLGD